MQSLHCLGCKHFLYADKCKAFDKIPAEILLGKNKHMEEYPGDKGIRFEKA